VKTCRAQKKRHQVARWLNFALVTNEKVTASHLHLKARGL